MESTNKGFLPPRIAINSLSSASPLTAPVPAGMLVYSTGGSVANGYYNWNGTKWVALANSSSTRDNHIIVKSEADLPTAVGGIITLASNSTYEVNGTVTITNKINLTNSIIKGAGGISDVLHYTPSSGELFTGANGGSIKDLVLAAPTSGAKIFNLNALGANQNLVVQSCRILNTHTVGTIKGFGGTVYMHTIAYQNNTNGITFENITNVIINNTLCDNNNRNTYEKFVGSFNVIQKVNGDMITLSANAAVGIDIAGITSLVAGELKTVLFNGTGTYVNGTFSKFWEVESQGLNTEKDAVASGNIYINSTASTSFAGANTPVKAAGTTTAANLFRVSAPANNRLTYNGTKSRKFYVNGMFSITSLSNNKYYSFYIAKNGVVLPESKQTRKMATGNDQGEMGISCIVELAPGDYIEVWVENNSDATGLTVHTMNLSIR